MSDVLNKLLDRAIPEPNTGCWLWSGAVYKNGLTYGFVNAKSYGSPLAHRVIYAEAVKPIPKGMCVLHKCDVPLCVNPDHLFLGTQDDNMKDMAAKGRSGNRKLSDNDIAAIRKDTRNQRLIAAEYGVSQPLISQYKNIAH